jgi:acyl-CoA synthetase (AMP-forming)/AMP-acid ligase II
MLIELVRRAAAADPEQPAVISAGREHSYAECLERSSAVAHRLRERGITRFGIALEDPAEIVVALAASSAVGSEACVYPRELGRDEVERLAEAFDHRVVLAEPGSGLQRGLAFDELVGEPPALPNVPGSTPVLVLTTGTTGTPKGASHDWSRLVEATRRRDPRPAQRWLLAYNLNQFGGLQVLLHVLASQATLVAAASARAADVIDAVRTHRVTHISATPTFWRLLAGSLDPRSAAAMHVQQVTLGGEPVQEGLIEKLRHLFPQARISQIYGSTEAGTAVSVNDGRSGLPLSILDRDENADVRLRIVDGELQMKSRIGMLGYYDSGSERPTDGGWRPTGDLVEVRDDRIHFVGRKGEIINVGGVKVRPLAVEELACAVDGVELAVAYGRRNAVTGQIVVLDVVAAPGADRRSLEAAIRTACDALPRAARPRRVNFVESLDLSGHKVKRPETGAHP